MLFARFLVAMQVAIFAASCASPSTPAPPPIPPGEPLEATAMRRNYLGASLPACFGDEYGPRRLARFVEDPGAPVGCFDVHEGEVGAVEPNGTLDLTPLRDLYYREYFAGIDCSERRDDVLVDVPCPEQVAFRGQFVMKGTFLDNSWPTSTRLSARWSETIDNKLALVVSSEMDSSISYMCLEATPDGFSGSRTRETGGGPPPKPTRFELRRRECNVEQLRARQTPPKLERAPDEDELNIWGKSMPECFRAKDLEPQPNASGCYELVVEESLGNPRRELGLVHLRPDAMLLPRAFDGFTCLKSDGDDLVAVPCPIARVGGQFTMNGDVLVRVRTDSPLPKDGTWAQTSGGHLKLAVGYGYSGAGACLTPTSTGFAGRLMQWTDAGPSFEYDPRQVTLTKVSCPSPSAASSSK